jgi:phosphoserine phosphatase
MNVYDFDNTIFRGDSTARFFLYCLRRRPRIARKLPGLTVNAALLLSGRLDKTKFKGGLFSFLNDIPDTESMVTAFWAENRRHVKRWYLAQKKPDDLIISASPEFLLKPVCPLLIASRVDPKTGTYTGRNCDGAEKLRRFREEYTEAPVEEFYSDSLGDAPMARIAKRAFLVRGDRITPWPL